MNNGFIYAVVNPFFNAIKYLNMVELFKTIGVKLNSNKGNTSTDPKYSRIATDIFIVLKFAFIFILIQNTVVNIWLVLFVWYLLLANLYTYFYYHIWDDKIFVDDYFETSRIKRRFVNLLFAFAFSIFGFSYLYSVPYASHFLSVIKSPNYFHYLGYSISNALTSNYELIKPKTDFGYLISIVQLIMTFIFVTIIISNSVPQINSQTNKR